MDDKEDNTIYKVVVNHEEQYSIWPAARENPLGWRDAGKSGTKAEFLAYLCQGSLDGYAATKFTEKDGGARTQSIATVSLLFFNIDHVRGRNRT